jgi:hypothetical protein
MKKLLLVLSLCLVASLAFAQQPINLVDVGGTALGAVSNYGTSPGAVAVIGVNAFITNSPAVTGSGVFEVGPTTAANTATNTFFFNISDGTHALSAAVSAWGTPPTGTEVMGVNANVLSLPSTPAGSNNIGSIDILGHAGASLDVAQGGATAATSALQIAGVYNTSLPTLTNGQGGAIQLDSSGRLLINCATGCSGGGSVSLAPQTTGGLSTKHFVAAASDNATNVKASAGQVYSIDAYNNAAYPVYFKLYNASASPTGCGATALFKVVGMQAGTQHTLQTEEGWAMGTGIGYCLTKGIADSDDTAVLLSDATIDLGYK